jgi:hypothetical protein
VSSSANVPALHRSPAPIHLHHNQQVQLTVYLIQRKHALSTVQGIPSHLDRTPPRLDATGRPPARLLVPRLGRLTDPLAPDSSTHALIILSTGRP